MTKLPPPNSRRARGRRAAAAIGRLAASSSAPTNPLLQQNVSVLGAAAESGGADAGSRRRSSPAPASPCSIKFFARSTAAPSRLSPARCASASPSSRHRLRRPGAPSRGLSRAARRRASSRQPARPPAPPGASHRLWRLFATRPDAVRRAKACAPPPICSNFRTASRPRGARRRLAGRPAAPNIRSRRRRAPARAAMELSGGAPRRRGRDFRAVARRSDAGAKTRLGRADPAAGDGDRRGRRRVGGRRPRPGDPDWATARLRLRAGRAGGLRLAADLSRRPRSCWRRAKAAGQRAPGGSSKCCSPTTRCRRRARRKPRGCRIAPAAVCSIGWSSSAPRANSPAARIFGSMDCSVFAQSGNRFARRKRVKKGM